VFDETEGFVAERGIYDFNAAGTDEVFEDFVEQDEVGLVAEQFQDVIAAGGNAGLVVFTNDVIAGLASERPSDPAPEGIGLAFAAGEVFSIGGAEKLTIEDSRADLADVREGFAFGDGIEGLAVVGGVEQGSQGMGLAAAERGDELENPVARAARKAREDVVQKRLQAGGEV
jgi:hypothetical protein